MMWMMTMMMCIALHDDNKGDHDKVGYEPDDDIETIRVHIRHLRTKLEPDPRHPKYIKTVYGAGYCLELPKDDDNHQDEGAIAE